MPDLLPSPITQIIALGIAGIVVWHLQGSRRQNARLVVQIAFFSLMTVVVIKAGIVPNQFEPASAGGYLLVAAKTLWWVHLAWASIGLLRLYLDFDGRSHNARLLQDLMVAAVYLGVALAVLSLVFGIAIGTLLATSGVIAIILGLALQSTLNDVFSGLALTLGRPYAIGDWILLTDGTEGRVVESTWRSTQILTIANNIVVLPNSYLAKIGMTNLSRPDEIHQVTLRFRVMITRSPSLITEAMEQALMGANSIVHDPPPLVALKGIDAVAVDIELFFNVRHVADRIPAQNEVVDLVHRQCKADGLTIAPSTSTAIFSEGAIAIGGPSDTLNDLLRADSAFAELTTDELERLAAQARLRRYRAGEFLLGEADSGPILGIISKGVATMERPGRPPLRLASGAIIGQIGNTTTAGKFRALTTLEVYEFDGPTLSPLLDDHPTVHRDLSRHFGKLSSDASGVDGRNAQQRRHAAVFLRAIQGVFHK